MRAQKGHQRCTSAGTDARVGSMVRVRVRHVIDRGERRTVRNSKKGEGGEEEVKEKDSPRRTVITSPLS